MYKHQLFIYILFNIFGYRKQAVKNLYSKISIDFHMIFKTENRDFDTAQTENLNFTDESIFKWHILS